MRKTRFHPRLVVKLKQPITHVEVLEVEAMGSVMVVTGTLTGWMNPENLEMPPGWRDRKISKENGPPKASRRPAK